MPSVKRKQKISLVIWGTLLRTAVTFLYKRSPRNVLLARLYS